MGSILALLDGRKAYILLAIYCVLVLFGGAPQGGVTLPDSAEIQKIVFAGALAALRAGVAKTQAAVAAKPE